MTNKKNIHLILSSSLTDRFIYYAVLAVTVLVLQKLHLDEAQTLKIYGLFVFISLTAKFTLGYLTEHFFIKSYALMIGLFLYAITMLYMSIHLNVESFLIGLVGIIMASGLIYGNVVACLRESCNTKTSHRAFSILYTCMNIGGISGSAITGIVSNYLSWGDIFLIWSLLPIISLLIALPFSKRAYNHNLKLKPTLKFLGYISLFIIFTAVLLKMPHHNYLTAWILALFVISLVLKELLKLKDIRAISLIIIASFVMMLFSFYSIQVYSSITLYVAHKFNLHITSGFYLSPITISIFWGMSGVVTTYVINHIILKHNPSTKLILRFFICGIIALACSAAYVYFNLNSPLTGKSNALLALPIYIFVGIAEGLIVPTSFNLITRIIPNSHGNRGMALWYFTSAMGGLLGGWLPQFWNDTLKQNIITTTNNHHVVYFGLCVGILILGALVVMLSNFVLTRNKIIIDI